MSAKTTSYGEPPSYNEKQQAAQPMTESMGSARFQTRFASLSLHMNDRIRLLDFPPEVLQIVKSSIQTAWPRGIQDQRQYGGSHEFKVYGNPWAASSSGHDTMQARRLMQRVFADLWSSGWLLFLSTDISKKQTDKDTLIFRHQIPPPAPCQWISVSFSRYDRIRLIDAPQDLRAALVRALGRAVQDSRAYDQPGIWEIKINGNPWHATGETTMYARRILLNLVTVLEEYGFTVYASIDQKATTQDGASESDTWHCNRAADWQPGATVYHT